MTDQPTDPPDLTTDDLASAITLLGYDPSQVATVILTPTRHHAIATTLVEPTPVAPEEATDADT